MKTALSPARRRQVKRLWRTTGASFTPALLDSLRVKKKNRHFTPTGIDSRVSTMLGHRGSDAPPVRHSLPLSSIPFG